MAIEARKPRGNSALVAFQLRDMLRRKPLARCAVTQLRVHRQSLPV